MKFNIRDKWLAIAVYRNPVEEGQQYNVTGTTKWKVCGSKSVASKFVNMWVREQDSNGQSALLDRMIQPRELGTLIKDYQMWTGKDAIKVADELTAVANEIVTMASKLNTRI